MWINQFDINIIILLFTSFLSTVVWVIASLLRFPGLFSVFWLISTMLGSVWSRFFLWFPFLPVSLASLLGIFLVRQLQLLSPSHLCCTDFFRSRSRSKYLFNFLLSYIFGVWFAGTVKSTEDNFLFRVNWDLGLTFLLEMGNCLTGQLVNVRQWPRKPSNILTIDRPVNQEMHLCK